MSQLFNIPHKPRTLSDGLETAAAHAPAPQVATSTGTEARPQQKLTPPFASPATATRPASAAPGVVPPPAAPIYAMRQAPNATGNAMSTNGNGTHAMDAAPPAKAIQRRAAPNAAPVPMRALRTRSGARPFDPAACAQAGLVNLAWRWKEAGSPIRAIHTYMELLHRYPDTPAASAAVADLVELSETLAQHGQFHTALLIYDQLERLLPPEPLE